MSLELNTISSTRTLPTILLSLLISSCGGSGILPGLGNIPIVENPVDPVDPIAQTRVEIPAMIQAEDFTAQAGIQTENTSDADGGENISHIEDGDYTEYLITVPSTETYTLNLRVASESDGGIVNIEQNGSNIGSIIVSSTDGWQNWETVSTTIELDEGDQTLRLVYNANTTDYLMNVNLLTLTSDEEPMVFPQLPFAENPEFVVIETNIGWVEGPTWVPDENGFIYNLTDRDGSDIHRLWRPGEDSTSEYWRVPGSNHGAIWSDGLIYLTNREPGRISYIDPSQDTIEETIIRDGLGRPNDLDIFSDGSIYFSDWPNGGMDGVYRLQMNGELEQIISPEFIANPNGMAFTADCNTLYVANTGNSLIAYDVAEDGSLSNQRTHASDLGNVNGIAVDVLGNIYVPSGDGVIVINSEGEQVGRWEGPQAVVNLTFGGEDNKWLLTTNKTGVTAVRTEIAGGECNGLQQ